MKYSVKIIFKYSVETGEVFFEQSVIMLNADSFEDAYCRAELYVNESGMCESYVNLKGKRVEVKVVSFADCFSVYDDDEVTEVYSSFLKAEGTSEDDILSVLEGGCSREELLPLREFDDPEQEDRAF